MFKGSITALITPFCESGREQADAAGTSVESGDTSSEGASIDWNAFDSLVEWQIAQGTHGLVPCGTTGESPTLSHEEHKKLVARCVDVAAGRVPVIAGTGSNSTREALELTQAAKEAGANAALVVTPYYNKPSQAGLEAHYRALNEIGLPIIIYNIPGRCVIDMSVETMAGLAALPHIVGVKDATADLARPLRIRETIGPDFCQLSGEDATATAFLAQGGHGCISVASNIAPAMCAAMQQAWMDGDIQAMEAYRDRLAPLFAALFCETSPAPVKYAAQALGLCDAAVRLPLVAASDRCRAAIDQALAHAGLISDESGPKLRAHG